MRVVLPIQEILDVHQQLPLNGIMEAGQTPFVVEVVYYTEPFPSSSRSVHMAGTKKSPR